jgi:hypothetical protein
LVEDFPAGTQVGGILFNGNGVRLEFLSEPDWYRVLEMGAAGFENTVELAPWP